MTNLRQAAEQLVERIDLEGASPLDWHEYTALRAALKKADEDRAWVEERKANWAEDKALAKRNALEEADRIRKAEEEGRCWACGHKAEQEQEPLVDCPRCGHCCPQRKPLTDEQVNECGMCGYVGKDKDKTGQCPKCRWDELRPLTGKAHQKPLTDDQIYEMYNEPRSDAEMLEFARAIEAAHGIKGEA